MLAEQVDHVIGVDTHRDSNTAAILNTAGALQAQATLATDAFGYRRLLAFAHKHAPGRRCWAIPNHRLHETQGRPKPRTHHSVHETGSTPYIDTDKPTHKHESACADRSVGRLALPT
jgi:hypothetical protein